MALRTILTYPNPLLRNKANSVDTFDDNLTTLAEDMAETMYDAPGIGLAATQIGEPLRLIVVDITEEGEERQFQTLVNPKITEAKGHQVDEEGCLSVPELTSKVKRFKEITVTYQDTSGAHKELTTADRFAVVLQHEIDHLDGILFVDHLSSLKRNLYKKKVKKFLAQNQTT